AAFEGSAGGSFAEVYTVPSAVEEHREEELLGGRGEHNTEHRGYRRQSHL
ncbi:hypothetical protein M9458_036103, partial [Cirrhinus mrigala]